MSDFESITYAEMISNARASLDFGTKEFYDEPQSFSYDELIEDLEHLESLSFDENSEDIDYGFEIDEDGFYIVPEIEYFSENDFDGHGNYMDDEYFFKRDYEGESCSLYPEDEDEECVF